MGLVLAMALAALAGGGETAATARHCSAVAGLPDGWTTMVQARLADDGKVEAAIFVAEPPIATVDGLPAGRRAPGLNFISAQGPGTGLPSESILLVQILTTALSDETGPDWTGQLRADGVKLVGGQMVWDKEAPSPLSPPGDRRVRTGRFVIDHPSAKLLETIDKAQEVTTIVDAPGRAPWITHYGKVRLASVQAGRGKALGLMRRAAQGSDILQVPDYASCRLGEPEAKPARPLEMPAVPPLPSLSPGY